MKKKNTFIRLLHQKDPDAILYLIGLIVALTILSVIVLVNLISHIAKFNLPDGCMFRSIFGIYCPGCGGTRAFISLIHGDFISAIYYHPFVVYAFPIILVFYISQSLRYITDDKIHGMRFRNIYIYIGIALLIINCIVKNILSI